MKGWHGFLIGMVFIVLLAGTVTTVFLLTGGKLPGLPSQPTGPGNGSAGCTLPGYQWDANSNQCVLMSQGTSYQPAPLYAGVRDGMGSALTSNTVVEVISKDLQSRIDTVTVAAVYSAGTTAIAPGAEFFLHVKSTVGNGYYDEFYHISSLGQNAPVSWMRVGMGTADRPAAIGSYDEVAVGKTIYYSTGQAVYWEITSDNSLTPLVVYQRETGANVKFTIGSPTVASVNTATGSTPTSGTAFSGTSVNTYAASGSTFTYTLNVKLTDTKQVYGRPMLSINNVYQWKARYLAMAISFNSTGIVSDTITGNSPIAGAPNWAPIQQSIPGYKSFFTVLPEIDSTTTSTANINLNIKVDTGSIASGVAVGLAVWVTDLQIQADAAQGTSDAAPVAINPPIAAYGLTTTLYTYGFQTNGSNIPYRYVTYAPFTSV